MIDEKFLTGLFPSYSAALLGEINENAVIKTIPENTEILREGQYIKVIPLVISGLIKVFTRYEDKELLLYYIEPRESCIMSFSAGLRNEPSKIYAVTEESTTALLLPIDKVVHWTKQYPDINVLFFQQFNLRYSDLLDTINQLIFNQLDKRLLDYLVKRTSLSRSDSLKISHRQIASELGTAREVISRLMKKLEQEGKVRQQNNNIIEIQAR